jgi:4-hydroxybenzoate polyprenyltransferase
MNAYLSLVKFSHTLFAMPFAMIGFVLGMSHLNFEVEQWPVKLLMVIICMITARNAAMAFNRYLDRNIDARNPRTIIREIPSGIVTAQSALIFVTINATLFILCTYFINTLCFYLSPIALAVILGYSYTKRFTYLCHIILGIGLGLAPVGAYLAVTGQFDITPILLGLAVVLWVAGFDIIYALQDENFDKTQNLYSIPSTYGYKRAIGISRILHTLSFLLLSASVIFIEGYSWKFVGIVFFFILLFYQHYIVHRYGLEKIDLAFFTTNGIGSVIFGLIIISALLPWEKFLP